MGKWYAAGWDSDDPTPAQLEEFFAQIGSGKVTGDRLQALLRGETGQPILPLTESEQIAAGWASDAPTPAQLEEFFAQIGPGKVTGDRLQAFLRGEIGQSILSFTESEQIAANILGHDKVAGYRAACQAWNQIPTENIPEMPFSKETLRQCAEENKHGADWRVVYVHGFSLRQQEKMRGRNCKKQPCFDPDYTWWLEKQQDGWGNQKVEAGYHLFDFPGRFGNMQWQTQEAEIGKLGHNFERAEEQAVAEAYFTFYLVSGKKERLLKNFWHWGRLLAASSCHVNVGCFEEDGFNVGNDWDDDPSDDLRVVLSRKS
jgi:hypothetical protein